MKVSNQITESRIGLCPSCSESIYATLEVGLDVTVSAPSSAAVTASAKANLVGAAIKHSCGTRPAVVANDTDYAVVA